jgi:hypothetical protein
VLVKGPWQFLIEIGAGFSWLYLRLGRRDWYFGPHSYRRE